MFSTHVCRQQLHQNNLLIHAISQKKHINRYK